MRKGVSFSPPRESFSVLPTIDCSCFGGRLSSKPGNLVHCLDSHGPIAPFRASQSSIHYWNPETEALEENTFCQHRPSRKLPGTEFAMASALIPDPETSTALTLRLVTTSAASPLLKLPRELRDIVYAYTLVEPGL